MIVAQNKPKRLTHKTSSSMHHPLQVFPWQQTTQRTRMTMTLHPINHPMEESNKCLGCCCFFCLVTRKDLL